MLIGFRDGIEGQRGELAPSHHEGTCLHLYPRFGIHLNDATHHRGLISATEKKEGSCLSLKRRNQERTDRRRDLPLG